MKKRIMVLIILGCFLAICRQGLCEGLLPNGNYIEVKVVIGQTSEIILPDKIANVVRGGEKDSVLVEVKDESIYLLPKSENPSGIYVITRNGERYYLHLILDKGYDYSIKVGQKTEKKEKKKINDTIGLLKSMLSGNVPSAATVIEAEGEIFNNGKISIINRVGYEFSNVCAFVMEAVNLLEKEVVIPVQDINYPNLLVISADEDLLAPKGNMGDSTLVYMIVRKSK